AGGQGGGHLQGGGGRAGAPLAKVGVTAPHRRPVEEPGRGVERGRPGSAAEGDRPEPVVGRRLLVRTERRMRTEGPLRPPGLGPHEVVVGLVHIPAVGCLSGDTPTPGPAEDLSHPGRPRAGQAGDQDPFAHDATARTRSSRTYLKSWRPSGPGAVLLPSWQMKRPKGKSGPSDAARASMPSVVEHPSASAPATTCNRPRKAW